MAGNCPTRQRDPDWPALLALGLLCVAVLSACGAQTTAGTAVVSTPAVPPRLRSRSEQVARPPCGPLWAEGEQATLRGLYRTSGGRAYLDVVHVLPSGEPHCWARVFLKEDLGLGALPWDAPRYVQASGRLSSSAWSSAGLWDLDVVSWALLPLDQSAAWRACQEGVASQTAALQALDWAALALPAYVTGTAGFVPPAEGLAQPTVQLLGADDRQPLLVLEARGPDLPAVRPLVTRWVALECVYDLESGQVVDLVATIRGEVQE